MADMGNGPEDHLTFSPSVLTLNTAAEVAQLANLVASNESPAAVQYRATRIAVRAMQAASAYAAQYPHNDIRPVGDSGGVSLDEELA